MTSKLQRIPLYVLLIPLFFVEHGFLENFGFIDVKDALLLVSIYCSSSLLLFFLFYLLYKRNSVKAGLLTGYLMAIYLFFGALQASLKAHAHLLCRYRILLPLLLIIFILLLFYTKRKEPRKSTLFINLLFIVYIGVDACLIAKSSIYSSKKEKTAAYSSINQFSKTVTQNTPKPDIYFLLFDEYASSLSLKNQYGFTNDLDSFLLNRGFHIQSKSHSNYNYTPVSMASMLNMSYLEKVKPNSLLTIEEINDCANLIKRNKVISFLSNQGYEIVNYSIFDLVGHPSPIRQTLLPLKTRLITDNTLFSKVYHELGTMFFGGRFSIDWLIRKRLYEISTNNDKILASIQQETTHSLTNPRFLYAHLYMPHDPFYYDKNGRLKDENSLLFERGSKRQLKDYLEYLLYVNNKIEKLIDTIQHNTKGKAVIILMGDHGFRLHIDQDLPQNYQNMNAVYFLDKNYNQFYDSISCINQFRVLFNSLFHQSFPLLKDSTIFLNGKE